MKISKLAQILLEDFEKNKRHIFTFVNEFYGANSKKQKYALIKDKPEIKEIRILALLASLAEWLAQKEDVPVPEWVKKIGSAIPAVYLTSNDTFKMIAFRDAPVVFRKRHIFIDPRSFEK